MKAIDPRFHGVLGALLILGGTAAAQTSPIPPLGVPSNEPQIPDPRGTFSFMLDNDLFAGTDKNYTSGFQFDWRSPSYDPPPWLSAITGRMSLIFPQGGTQRWGLSLGQNIFTPEDTARRNPDPLDRPYAGWLFGAISLASYTPTSYGSIELQMGIVGPGALGEQFQNGVHRIRGFDLAEGWSHQLKDEFGFNVIAGRQWRWNYETGIEGLQYGFVPSLTASLGNVYTYASAGMMIRLGSNLGADFGPPRTRPAQSGSAFFQPQGDGFGWYVFAGVEGRAVARNIFLDGNTWRDGPRVDREPLVGDMSAGVAVMFRRARLTATYTIRSREFETQHGNSQYGSIAVAFRF
ncbi:lipid A deacylase LpxR family protein [Roseococcus pinisoli]|uniref:Lipid A deacylase LpxR family protein n=1 Tax=Roseococcus pinisoli TaxID=2835040 RepID=A0ABS5QBP6_9PROT|nr:lipid A deacylase LpxR family protein [Roseococcus pinisoli]MBS7811114.1 lipid A deacylase LpxR family protein [Roseococcus pinisoli]